MTLDESAPLWTQPEVVVAINTILLRPGWAGFRIFQIQCISNSLVGFFRPAMSFR